MARAKTTVQVQDCDIAFLAARGARSQRGGGDFCRSAVLHRALVQLEGLLAACDPVAAGRIDPRLAQLVARLLPRPWERTEFEIEELGRFLARTPGFLDAVAAAGLGREAALAGIEGLSTAEKLVLVDAAVRCQAPAGGGSGAGEVEGDGMSERGREWP